MASTDVVEKVGQLVEELRQGIEQHRLVEVLGRLEHPHRVDPVGEDPFPVGAQEIREPARLVGHGPLLHGLNVDITASRCKAAWRESVASLEARIRSPNPPFLALLLETARNLMAVAKGIRKVVATAEADSACQPQSAASRP